MTQTYQFQAGDIVRCIDAGMYNQDLTEGANYVVIRTTEGAHDSYVEVKGDDDIVAEYYTRRFERQNTFRVGDKVKIKHSHVPSAVDVGAIGTVTKVCNGNDVIYEVDTGYNSTNMLFGDGYNFSFYQQWLEAYEEVQYDHDFKEGEKVEVLGHEYPSNVPAGIYTTVGIYKRGVIIPSVIDGAKFYVSARDVVKYVEPEIVEVEEEIVNVDGYEVGDKVKVVHNDFNFDNITVGKVYKVIKVFVNGVDIDSDNGEVTYMHNREVEVAVPEFKEGDKVRCLDGSGTSYLTTDEVYEVSGILKDGSINLVEVINRYSFGYAPSMFELVTKPTKSGQQYNAAGAEIFSVGDKVLAKDVDFGTAENGKVYTVEAARDASFEGNGQMLKLEGHGMMYFSTRFELFEGIEEAAEEVEESPVKEYTVTVQREGDEVYMAITGKLSEAQVDAIFAIIK